MKTLHDSRYVIVLVLLWGCVTPYTPNISYPATGYLVVEGNLNAGQATTISLSRTTPISAENNEVFENGATVTVEGSDGSMVSLPQSAPGQYSVGSLPMDTNNTYRLDVQTKDGDEFQSAFVKPLPTPAIDSVTWSWLSDGVHFYVSTHDPQNKTKYFEWNFSETWEYHSNQQSFYYWDPQAQQILPRDSAMQIYSCWHTDNSSDLLLYSTAKLSQSVVNDFQINLIPNDDQRLSVLYSLQVNQVGLSDSAYAYLELMLANTENLGSIFDPLPTQLFGNIHSLKNPSEQVIGYVNASATSSVRIFVSEPPAWGYFFPCPSPDTIPPQMWYAWFYQGQTPSPYPTGVVPPCCIFDPIALTSPPSPTGYYSNVESCIDCTLMGGSTTKPSYWPW